MAITAATLVAKFTADTSAFKRGLAEVEAGTSKSFSIASHAAAIGGLGIAAGIGYALKKAAEYQEAMNIFGAVTRASKKDMEEAGRIAKQLGADAKLPATSASDAAKAMTELAKAGFDVKTSMAAAHGVLQLSAAAQIDNAKSARIVSQAMQTFGLKTKDFSKNMREANRVVDLFAGTANASQAEIEDVADAFRYSAAQARQAGVPIEDLTTMIAQLSNRGIEASVAGTSLRALFTRLTPTTLKAAGAFKTLGLMTEDGKNKLFNAKGEFIGVSKAADLVKKGMSGLSQQQRIYNLWAAFGVAGTRAVVNSLGQGSKAFVDLKKQVTEHGSAARIAAARNAGLKGQMDALKSAVETLAITIGEDLLPAATAVVHVMIGFANVLTKHKTTLELVVGAMGAFAFSVLAVNVALKIGRSAVLLYEAATGAATGAMWLFNAAISANPIGLLVIGLFALGVALVVAYKKSETFRNIVNGAFKEIQDVAETFVRFFKKTLPDAFDDVLKWVKNNWPEIVTIISGPFAPLVALATGAFGIRDALVGAFEKAGGLIGKAGEWAGKIVSGFTDGLKTIGTDAWNIIKTIGTTIESSADAIIGWGTSIANTIKKAVTETLLGIGEGAWKVINNIGEKITAMVDTIISWGTGIGQKVKTAAIDAVMGIGIGVWNIIDNIGTTIAGFAERIIGWGSSVGSKVKSGAVEGVTGIAGAVWNIVDNIRSTFIDNASKVLSWGESLGKKIVTGIIDGLEDLPGKLLDAIKSAINSIADKIPHIHVPFIGGGDPANPSLTLPPGTGVGGLIGSNKDIDPSLWDELGLAKSMGLVLTSGYRPGAITSHGTPSDHGVYPSKAIDVAGSADAMARFFLSLVGDAGVKQAFYDPLGSIFGGALSGYREGGHSDHVHVATYDAGGFLQPGVTMAINKTREPEPVLTGKQWKQMSGRGGTTVNHYHFDNYVGSKSELMELIDSANAERRRTTPYGSTSRYRLYG